VRILNIHSYPFGLVNKEGSPNGGGEKVHLDIHHLLEENGIDIYSFCSESDPLHGDRWVKVLPSGGLDPWKKNKTQIYADITKAINKLKPDIIINNGSDKLLRLTNHLRIPSLFVDHRSNDIHKLYHADFFTNSAFKNRELGGKSVTVSLYSQLTKNNVIKKYWGDKGYELDGYLQFQYVTPELESYEVAKYKTKNCITIGRPETNKNPHRIKKFAEKYKLDYRIITQLPDKPKPDTEKYFNEKIVANPGVLKRTHVNIGRKFTMTMLKNSMLYYSTSEIESAGITAFESLCLGVPLVLYSPLRYHASQMFAPDGEKYCWDYDNKTANLEEYVEHCKSLNFDQRREIANYTRSHSSKRIIAMKIIQQLDSIYNNKKPVGLEDYV
jgi:hypothetical protein